MVKLVVAFLLIFSSSISLADVNLENIRNQLSLYLETDDIPNIVTKTVAAFDDMMGIMKCVPNIKDDHDQDLYKSAPCRVPHTQHNAEISIVVSFRKKPWRMDIDVVECKVSDVELGQFGFYVPFEGAYYQKYGYIPMNHDFMARLKSNVPDTSLRMILEGAIRLDCGLPAGDENLKLRSELNMNSPAGYNALYHFLKVRVELKKNSKCVLCAEIFNRKGDVGYGPQSCADDVQHFKQIS